MKSKLIYPKFIWKNYLGLIIFSSLFLAMMQFLVLFIVTTLDYGPVFKMMLSRLPEQLRTIFETEFLQRFTPDGASAFGLNHPLVIAVLSISAIIIPARHVAGEIENGTLEILLTYPVERWRHIITVWFSSASELLFITLSGLGGSFLAIAIFHEYSQHIVLGMLKIGFNLWLLFLLITSYTLLISSFSKEAGKAGIKSAAIALIFYLAQFLSNMWKELAFLKPFNIFEYYQPQKLMFDERSVLLNVLTLCSAIIVCLVITIYQFRKRDIPG